MPRPNETAKITEFLRSLSADELVYTANAVAGTLAARFVSYPDGQPAPGFDYPLYDAESASSAFNQAAAYIAARATAAIATIDL